MRVLELYCGIGGCAAALDGLGARSGIEVVAALDVNRRALAIYQRNFPHSSLVANIETLDENRLRGFDADLWWLSPPCQPFTRRGKQLDDADPRSRSLLALLPSIAALRPRFVALENVPGFGGSRTHRRLRAALDAAGYDVAERVLCPTALGVPNRRRRFYLVAGREPLAAWPPLDRRGRSRRRPLADFIDADLDQTLRVEPELEARYRGALDIIDPRIDPGADPAVDSAAISACFTAAYGRSPVRSGSYVRLRDGGIRRFSPREILSLLGFPACYQLPEDLPASTLWPLVGNSLSVTAVRFVLAAIPDLGVMQQPAQGASKAAHALHTRRTSSAASTVSADVENC